MKYTQTEGKRQRSIHEILATYPRTRPPLSEAHAEVYAEQYRINRDGETAFDGAAQRLEQWMHRRVGGIAGGDVLELGAGTLNHLRFEHRVDGYDVVEPFKELYDGRSECTQIRNFFDSVQAVPSDQRYRRIISVAVLEHLPDLPADVARSALLLDKGGVFQAGIPSEGGFLWWLGWRFSTGIAYYLRTGLDYGVLMRHEHVNDAPTIIDIVRYFFQDVAIVRFPSPLHQLSFYAYLEATSPRVDRAHAFLSSRSRTEH